MIIIPKPLRKRIAQPFRRNSQRGFLLNPFRFGAAAPTFDPAQLGGTAPTLSGGNVTATGPVVSEGTARTTSSRSSGKWYFEMICAGPASNAIHKIGVLKSGAIPTSLGGTAIGYSYYRAGPFDGNYYNNGATSGSPPTIPANGVVMVAVDIDAGKLWFGVNGAWQGDPAAGTGQAFSGITGDIWPACSVQNTGVVTYRPTAATQAYGAPSGFAAWA